MTLEKLEKQVLLWNKAAILVPIFFTALLVALWFFNLCNLETLFFVACGLYFTTAVIWWWWTMKSVHLLVRIMQSTNEGIIQVSTELRSIRKELEIDKDKDK